MENIKALPDKTLTVTKSYLAEVIAFAGKSVKYVIVWKDDARVLRWEGCHSKDRAANLAKALHNALLPFNVFARQEEEIQW